MGISVRSFVALFVVVVFGLPAFPAAAGAVGGSANPCALADALAHDGEREAAHAQYLKVIETTNRDVPCADSGLMATQPPSTTSLSSTVGDIAKGIGYALGAILLILLLLIVAALLWLQLQTRAPWLRDRWPAHRIRRPVFSVEPLTDTGTDPLGSAVAGLIRGRVTWRTDRFGLNLVSGQAGVATAFSGLGDISSEAKAAVAVVEFLTALLPRRRFQLTGQLQPAGEEGVGISLELSQNGNAEALTSLWAESFHITHPPNNTSAPNASAYQQLAVAGAAWVDIWMTKAVDGGALLTSDPVSWAFFRSGVDAQRLGERDRAQVLYEQALAADGTNVGALANLGIICRRARRYEDARDYLERALKPTEGQSMAPHLQPDENPDWYRIKYQIAALYANWAVESEGLKKDDRARRAATEAKQLADTTLGTLARLAKGGRAQGRGPRAYLQGTLRPFLTGTIEPSVLTLLASSVAPFPDRPDGWPPHDRPSREDVLASLTANDLDPWQLIAYVERGPYRPPETQFNLACFYTRAGDLTTGSKRLLQAVRETQRQERQRLVDVALLDPVLRPLLEKRPGIKAKLYEMVDAQAPFADADALARHFDRQDRTISHFQSLGYAVNWNVDTKDIDLTASKDSQVLLIRTPGPKPSRDSVASASGMIRTFEKEHPDIKHVKTSMVLPAINDYPADALAHAREHGMEVLVDTGHGFENADGDLP